MDNPDALAALDIAAVKLTMDGVFDARIKELKAAMADFDKRDLIVKTLEEAKKIKIEAEKDAAYVAANSASVKNMEKDVAKREEGLAKAKSDMAERESSVTKSEQDLAAREAKIAAAVVSAGKAEADSRAETALAMQKITNQRAELEADKAEFNKKLAALRV